MEISWFVFQMYNSIIEASILSIDASWIACLSYKSPILISWIWVRTSKFDIEVSWYRLSWTNQAMEVSLSAKDPSIYSNNPETSVEMADLSSSIEASWEKFQSKR